MDPRSLADALTRPRRLKGEGPQPSVMLEHNGVETALHFRGAEPTAPRALLVHGWETDHRDLSVIADALSHLGYYCVLPDLPAHGSSPGETMLIPEAADTLIEVGLAHGPFEVCVAHSLGAAVALVAISKGLTIRRVGFLAPPSNYVHQLKRSARAAGAPDPLVAQALEVLRTRCPALDEVDSLNMAQHLTMRGLVVVAGRDETLDPGDGRKLAAAWPAATLLDLPDATHRSVLRDGATIRAISELAR